MHFWIDKRSQCAYTGRHRVPPSLSAGRSRGRACAGARKGMAAPVHRFAAVDCPPRRPHRAHRHYTPPPVPAVHNAARRQNEDSIYVEIPMEPPQPTIASLAAARSVTPDTLLRTAALRLQPSPMMEPHLKFGMLVSFALATMFLAGAKYYFDKQVVRDNSSGNEAAVVCAAVACVCSVGCALSLCRAAPAPLQQPDRVSSTARRHHQPHPPDTVVRDNSSGNEAAVVCAAVACVCSVGCALSLCRAAPAPLQQPDRVSSTARRHHQPHPPDTQSEPSEDMSLGTMLPSEASRESPEAPPPYKIAVLMPGRQSPPPPAYSELS